MHLDPPLRHLVRGHRLDAEVDGDDPVPRLALRGDDVAGGGGDFVGEVRTRHRRGLLHAPEQGGRVGLDAGHPDPHGAPLAQVPGEGAGVDVLHADDPLRAELVLQGAAGAPAGRHPGGVADHVARNPDLPGLVVLVVPARVPDVRRGGDDDLAVVAGVGQGLLVTRHPGGEDRLAEGLPDGSVGPAGEGPTVLEDQQRCRWTGVGGSWTRRIGCAHARPFLPHRTGLKGWKIAATLPVGRTPTPRAREPRDWPGTAAGPVCARGSRPAAGAQADWAGGAASGVLVASTALSRPVR